MIMSRRCICVALAGSFIYLASAGSSLWGDDCDPIKQTSAISSPSGEFEALILHQACAGGFGSGSERYWIKVRPAATEPSTGITIFAVERYLPDIAWSTPARLVITIKLISDISLSLHTAYDVEVVYRIGDGLQPDQMTREIAEYEARAKQDLREGKSTFTGNPATDPEALNRAISLWKSHYTSFLVWAARNAENAPR